jgi:hypothetical protein
MMDSKKICKGDKRLIHREGNIHFDRLANTYKTGVQIPKRPVLFSQKGMEGEMCKPKKIWKKKIEIAKEKKLASYYKFMESKIFKYYERKTRLWKIRSDFGLVLKSTNKNFFRQTSRYFLEQLFRRFKGKFLNFETLRIKYVIWALIVFFKKIINLVLQRDLWSKRVKNTKLFTFYFFWQAFLVNFFDIFFRKGFGSGLFRFENKLQQFCLKKFWCINRRRKKRISKFQSVSLKQSEKNNVFNCFINQNQNVRINYLLSGFNFSKRLHDRKQLKFKYKGKQKNLKDIYSGRKKYKRQKKAVIFNWLVINNKPALGKKIIFFNSKNKQISVKFKIQDYVNYRLHGPVVNLIAAEAGLNLFIRNKQGMRNLDANTKNSHLIIIKITTTNIYLTILTCRLITAAKFSIGLAGFRKKKIKKQNYILKKINGILVSFLLQYSLKWHIKFDVIPRFRVIIRSGFINKRLKILLNNFFYFIKKRKSILRSKLYFKSKRIRRFCKNHIKKFKRKYRFFNFAFTHNILTSDIYLNKLTFNRRRFYIKYAAKKYVNLIRLARVFNNMLYYFQNRNEWVQTIKRHRSKKPIEFDKRLSKFGKKLKRRFRNNWPNLRTFNVKRSRRWTNINLFFHLYFAYSRFLIAKNYKKFNSALNLITDKKPKMKRKIEFKSQLPPVKMWYAFSREMWDAVAKTQAQVQNNKK